MNVTKARSGRVVACLLAIVMAAPGAYSSESLSIQPQDIPRKGGAEYFSASPESKILMQVNIWGEVNLPGIHLIPADSSLVNAVSAAGGPSADADPSDITIRRKSDVFRLTLLDDGHEFRLQAHDTIFVDRSLRRDMPLIFSAITTVVSVLTLYYVTRNR